ncbi:MAG: hypothetical protein ISEC1_P0498 [Thiomicrorhabdus sp.]|nr:MAG: hypothetical protein ISEC1_P0498 [Thiomicrorhabdus sp.]
MFKRLFSIVVLSILSALSISAQASPFSYQEFTLGSEAVSITGSTGTLNAFGIGATFPIREQIFITARYATGSGTIDALEMKVNGTALGMGAQLRIAESTDLVAGGYLSTGSQGLSAGGMSTSVSSVSETLYVGFRTLVTQMVELNGYYHLSRTGNSSSQIGGRYYFNNGFGITAGVATSDTVQSGALGIVVAY